MDKSAGLEKLKYIDRERRLLERASALLRWDEETYLPEKGVEERADQLALLERLGHEAFVRPETGKLLAEMGSDAANPRGDESLPPLDRDFLRVMRRSYDRASRLPPDFVANAARAEGLSQAAWVKARKNDDFSTFLPHLQTMIDFARRKAEYWGYGKGGDSPGSVYDGLLDIYEPGMGAAQIKAVFGPLRERLQTLLKAIAQKPLPDVSFLDQDYDTGVQARFNLRLMDILGFDKSRGRLDVSAHPFTTTLGSDDVRITTRYFPRNLLSSIFSTIHESGHAFYDMAFPEALRGSCLADGASMAVHESQSRFWENVIGRSRPFWEALFPVLKEYFPAQLRDSRAEALYRGANMVRPSLIRVDADEVSYSLHIILRFELEEALFSGELEPQNLPGEWRRRMKEIIGVENDTDANGVLQDVHWSMGSFGYFPSYALGNLYGLQFLKKLRSDLPGFEDHIGQLRFDEVRRWLGENIHTWGCRLEPGELLKKVTGENLSASAFLEYIEGKYRGIYGI